MRSPTAATPVAGRKGLLATAATVGLALLPKLTCPACWPAYAGLLSALGVGAFNYTPYLLPLTLGGLAVALWALAFRARSRRGYGPFVLGIAGAAVLLGGKFALEREGVMYAGIAFLVGASIWNAWPRRPGPCPACVPGGQAAHPAERKPGTTEVEP